MKTSKRKNVKLLVVGLDGATFDLIHPLTAQGRLPNLAAMLRDGASAPLHSTIPPITPAAWTSFFTGKNPGRHGIYDFQKFDRATAQFSPLHTGLHREKTLWDILGEAKLQSIIWDVPFTWPARPLNGWMLTGYGTPGGPRSRHLYPPDMAALIPAHFHSQLRPALPLENFDRSQRFIDEWRSIMAARRELFNWLIRERPWDLFMLVFSITDNMAHVFWTYGDPAHPNFLRPEAPSFRQALHDAYVACDEILGDLIAAAGEDAVTLVISDHGFGSVRPRQYLLQRLLAGGYVTMQAGRRSLKTRLAALVSRLYLRFPFLREWVKRLAPASRQTLAASLKTAGLLPDPASLDRQRSRVIVAEFGLSLWLNENAVPAGQRAALLAELSAFLLADLDPVTGQPCVQRVHLGADIYHGDHASQCPDLVIEYANSFKFDAPPSGDNPFTEGGHTPEGILLARGEGIQPGSQGFPASLVDLAPTILHLLGQPIPPDMDGRVLEEMFTRVFLDAHPIQPGTEPARKASAPLDESFSPEEEAGVLDQLRRLGYV